MKDFEQALQNFIQSLQLHRQLDDDGARKACIACFTILSQDHPLTIAYRRWLSMSLYLASECNRQKHITITPSPFLLITLYLLLSGFVFRNLLSHLNKPFRQNIDFLPQKQNE